MVQAVVLGTDALWHDLFVRDFARSPGESDGLGFGAASRGLHWAQAGAAAVPCPLYTRYMEQLRERAAVLRANRGAESLVRQGQRERVEQAQGALAQHFRHSVPFMALVPKQVRVM